MKQIILLCFVMLRGSDVLDDIKNTRSTQHHKTMSTHGAGRSRNSDKNQMHGNGESRRRRKVTKKTKLRKQSRNDKLAAIGGLTNLPLKSRNLHKKLLNLGLTTLFLQVSSGMRAQHASMSMWSRKAKVSTNPINEERRWCSGFCFHFRP